MLQLSTRSFFFFFSARRFYFCFWLTIAAFVAKVKDDRIEISCEIRKWKRKWRITEKNIEINMEMDSLDCRDFFTRLRQLSRETFLQPFAFPATLSSFFLSFVQSLFLFVILRISGKLPHISQFTSNKSHVLLYYDTSFINRDISHDTLINNDIK